VQSVSPEDSSSFSGLLGQIKKEIGVGAVINTSFNLAGEPIVDSPFDAVRTFYSSGIDVLYIENFKLEKTN
jgi:carbamoyltransferase